MISKHHEARIKAMKRYQVISYDEANELPIGELLEYFLKNCKGMGMQYDEGQFIAILTKVAQGIVSGEDADPVEDSIDRERMERNHTWSRNHLRLLQLVTNGLEERGCLPPVTYIARELNLSRVTVTNHLKDLNNGERSDLVEGKIELLRERALSLLYREGVYSNRTPDRIRALSAFLKLTQRLERRVGQHINPTFIQVNNIAISPSLISNLPESKQKEIADIIIESLAIARNGNSDSSIISLSTVS